MATKHAVALRAFNHDGDEFAAGKVDAIDAGHLLEWSAAGLVREATAAEVAKSKGEKPARRSSPRSRKVKPAPAPASAEPATATQAPDPAAAAA